MSYASHARVCCLGIGLGLLLLAASCGGGSSSPAPSPVPQVSVSISPPSANVPVGSTVQFTATVTGTSNTSVTWSVNGTTGGNSNVGTISTSGLYTAPSAVPSTNPVTVKATSQADTSKSAPASVRIMSASPQTVAVIAGQETSGVNIDVSPLTPTLQLIAVGIGNTAGSIGVTVNQGNTYSLLLVGNGLVSGTFYAVSGNPSDVQVTQPTGSDFGETTDNPPFPAVNVSIRVSGNAALGARNIMVTNPAGELSVFVGGLLITGP